jgi:CTP synthase
MHVTLVPYIKAAGELKTKPSQQSIAKLREIGLHPDILIARAEHPVDEETRKKLSVFCNVPLHAVFECQDVDTVYRVPLVLQQEKLDEVVCQRLGLDVPPADMADWEKFVKRLTQPKKRLRLAVVGKYLDHKDAYKSIYESIFHAAAALDCKVEIIEVDAEDLHDCELDERLHDVSGILVPGGFGERGTEGKICAAQFSREHNVPYLGLCLGMQIATIEFARNVLGLQGANSTEFDKKSPHPVIDLLPDQKKVKDKGATMRLGTWPTVLKEGTRGAQLYGAPEIRERHRHRYEFNQDYRQQMEDAGFIIAGTSPDGRLVELIELRDHPWFLACQYHPEFKSKPNAPHPLFKGFIAACLAHAH